MKMRVLIGIVTGLFLAGAPGIWGAQVFGAGGGLAATPKLHVRGQGFVKNFKPNYIAGYGYHPSQIKAAYGISGTGAGQTIAIIDAYGSSTVTQDLQYFSQTFGLPQATLNIYYPGGYPTTTDADWALETSLDVEWAHALAPRATIALVIAPTNSDADLMTAVQYAAQTLQAHVVSMSWGGDESSDETAYDSYFQNSETVFIAASGDSGSGAQYPAASPYVIAAGGTALYLNKNTGTRKFPEVAWEGSGGGVSQYEPIPSYQAGLGLPGSYRIVPDVGLVSDPNTGVVVYDSNYDPSTGNWWVVGGTSVATPTWAAIVAIVNQIRTAAKLSPLTDGHTALYNLASTSARYNRYYRDITAGYNGDYAATTGYDYITGLGCPKANVLIPALKTAK